jgi:hypothetical protein
MQTAYHQDHPIFDKDEAFKLDPTVSGKLTLATLPRRIMTLQVLLKLLCV